MSSGCIRAPENGKFYSHTNFKSHRLEKIPAHISNCAVYPVYARGLALIDKRRFPFTYNSLVSVRPVCRSDCRATAPVACDMSCKQVTTLVRRLVLSLGDWDYPSLLL